MIKIGLVGLGNHMMTTIYPALLKLPVQIMSVCDKEQEKIENFCRFLRLPENKCYQSYEEMLSQEILDAVICVGNAKLHYLVACESLKKGIPIFVEKTPCETSEQAREICRLEKRYKTYAMVGFNRRFSTVYRMMKKIIASEEFGSQSMYISKYNAGEYSSDDYFVFNHIIHHLDLMRYLLGEIREISAVKKKIADGKSGYHISFISESGVIGFLQSASLQCESYPMERVEITGNRSVIIADNIRGLVYNRFTENKTQDNPELLEKSDALSWNYNHGHSSMYSHYGYERELKLFIEAVANKKKPENTFEEVLKTMELYERLQQNIREVEGERNDKKDNN